MKYFREKEHPQFLGWPPPKSVPHAW